MRAVLDGDLDAGSRYADEVATLAETAQSPNAEMMSWTLRWRIARLRQDTNAIGKLTERMAEWAESLPGGTACSRCCSPSREIPNAGDGICFG